MSDENLFKLDLVPKEGKSGFVLSAERPSEIPDREPEKCSADVELREGALPTDFEGATIKISGDRNFCKAILHSVQAQKLIKEKLG